MTYTIEDVKARGQNHGYDIASINAPEAKSYNKVWENPDLDGYNIEGLIDEIQCLCYDADESYRQYSPFEVFAHELNSSPNAEELWEAYDEGISKGIELFTDELAQELNDYAQELHHAKSSTK